MTVNHEIVSTEYGKDRLSIITCDICQKKVTMYEAMDVIASWIKLRLYGGSLDFEGNFCSPHCLKKYVDLLPQKFDYSSVFNFKRRLIKFQTDSK